MDVERPHDAELGDLDADVAEVHEVPGHAVVEEPADEALEVVEVRDAERRLVAPPRALRLLAVGARAQARDARRAPCGPSST